MTEILAPTGANVSRAAAAVREGRLVGMPTETVYGLAANALDAQAVARIYAAKRRPTFNPLIAHVSADQGDLRTLDEAGLIRLDALEEVAQEAGNALICAFWPGPLSIVLPVGSAVPDLTCAGLDTVALRSPDHPVAQALLRAVGVPLAAPSANRSGRISPTRAEHVIRELGDRVDCVLDGGTCRVGLESTVVQLDSQGKVTVLRPGAVSREQLERVVGRAVYQARALDDSLPRSPGMGSKHYAPSAAFVALPAKIGALDRVGVASLRRLLGTNKVVGVLCWSRSDAESASARLGRSVCAVSLTTDGDMVEAGRNLFQRLRDLEELGCDLLLCEPCPPRDEGRGLGWAINNRLSRATIPLVVSSA